jgi:UDP-N-acetylmuramyl tripeptide synthase
MTHLIITNITRDQPCRHGNHDIVFKDVLSAIGDETKIIIDADDPLVNTIKYNLKNEVVTYGVAKTKDSYKTPAINNVDHAYCPLCHTKLIYDYYHYGHVGNYHCPKCEFKRGKVDYEATDINLEEPSIKIEGKKYRLSKDALYAAYYTLAAYSLCSDIIGDESKVLNTINTLETDSKRGKTLMVNDRPVTMLESKNENNLSYYQSLKYITNQPGKKTVVLGFENVSRRYKYNDLSWLWDVDFELLNDKNIDKIFVIGRFRYDIMTRFEFTDIPKDKIVLIDDLSTLIKRVKNESSGDIYTMVCFDMTANIKALIKEDENENN